MFQIQRGGWWKEEEEDEGRVEEQEEMEMGGRVSKSDLFLKVWPHFLMEY